MTEIFVSCLGCVGECVIDITYIPNVKGYVAKYKVESEKNYHETNCTLTPEQVAKMEEQAAGEMNNNIYLL